MEDIFNIRSQALPNATRVIAFRGLERLSRPYELRIDLLVPHGTHFDPSKVIGERASLTIDRHDGRPPLHHHGVLTSADVMLEIDRGEVCRVVLVPAFARLAVPHQSRVFVDTTLPKILEAILLDGGLASDDFELRLERVYKPIDHVCQYEESHFAFVSRWMEREGLYYFFEQGEQREKLVITDSKGFHKPLSPDPVRFLQASRGTSAALERPESLDSLTIRHHSLPAKVRFRDYDYQKPDLDMSASSAVSSGHGDVKIFGHGFETPDDAKHLANVLSQALQATQSVYQAAGNQLYLRPGFIFQLEEHPRPALNAKYLVTALQHTANQLAHALGVAPMLGFDQHEVYRCELTAIPAALQFRAMRTTPSPRIEGTVSAVVDGAADHDYAQLDKHGRYRVKILFDEGDLKNGKASTWVRMMQPHGGSPEGFHFPLRKGTEVLLTFLGGDPDQPVIAGVVPNAKNPTPVGEDNHTKNIIHTGGGNQIVMEDHESKRSIKLRTPHMNTMLHLGAPNSPAEGFHLGTDANGSFFVKRDLDTQVLGKADTQVTGAYSVSGASISETASLNRTDTSQNHFLNTNGFWLDAKDTFQTVTPKIVEYCETRVTNGNESINFRCWGATLSMTHDLIKVTVGSSTIEITPTGIVITGAEVNITSPGPIDVKGSIIKLNS